MDWVVTTLEELVVFNGHRDLLETKCFFNREIFQFSSRYCMLGYCEDAPENWHCQECDFGKGVMSSSHELENELHASAKICPSNVQPKKHSKFPRAHCINWESTH